MFHVVVGRGVRHPSYVLINKHNLKRNSRQINTMHPNMWQLHRNNGNINEAAENLNEVPHHHHEQQQQQQHYNHQRLGLENPSFPRSTSQNMDFAPTAAAAAAAGVLHNSSGHGGISSSGGARRSIEKSHSLPVVNNRQYHHNRHQAGLGSAMQNETFGNFTMHHHQINNHQSGGRCNSNPFLENSIGGMMSFATTSGPPEVGNFAGTTQITTTTSQLSSNSSHLSTSASTTRSVTSSANSATINHDEDLLHHQHHGPSTSTNNLGGGKKDDLAAFMDRALRGGRGGGGVGTTISINGAPSTTTSATASSRLFPRSQSNNIINTVAPSPTPQQLHHPNTNNQTTATTTPSIGPSKLYRLIASPPQDTPLDWDSILHRAISHPHEACFFDPNAGGHVFALHKLLRRTGDNNYCRPPLAVVDAVMEACPRAVTRKQAVVDEDELVDDERSDNINVVMGEQQLVPPPVMQPPQHPLQEHPNNDNDQINDDDDDADSHRPQDEENDHDDVRFEYPLAIACEWEQDGEIVRLLASALQKTNPVYRSEVFRSLDYASLPNHYVRILLEENPACVMERGTSSEENEGDDDDSPLEKVLFWWDDPDMMGMEDDIASYPDCNMRDDLNDLFEKLRMMLYAAAKGSMDGYDDNKMQFQVLHHVLRIVSKGGIGDVHFPNDFAHAVLLIAKFIQREQAAMFQERDEAGSLPLHIACSGQGLVRPSDGMSAESNHTTDATNNVAHDDADEEGDGAHARENNNVQNDVDAPDDQLEEEDEEEDVEGDDGYDESEHDEAGERSSGPSGMEVIALLLENNPNSIRLRDSLTGSLPLHLALQCNPHVVEMVEKLIDLFPLSISMPDGSGRLPLHIALLQKSPSWEKILTLYPAALESRDPMTGLLPFQVAAMSTNSNGIASDDLEGGDDSLSLCFQLLRKNPCLATGLGKKEETPPRSLIEQQIMARYKPRVVKLEEENERLQQRVRELESQLRSMMVDASQHSGFKKKRKSSATLGC